MEQGSIPPDGEAQRPLATPVTAPVACGAPEASESPVEPRKAVQAAASPALQQHSESPINNQQAAGPGVGGTVFASRPQGETALLPSQWSQPQPGSSLPPAYAPTTPAGYVGYRSFSHAPGAAQPYAPVTSSNPHQQQQQQPYTTQMLPGS